MPRKKIEKLEWDYFLVLIEDWDAYYSFGLKPPKFDRGLGPYHETTYIEIQGKVFKENLCLKIPKDQKAVITLYDRDDHEDVEYVRCAGMMSINGLNELSIYLQIPTRSFAAILGILNSGKAKMAEIGATRLKYKSALVKDIRIDTRFNPEEY